MACCSGFALNTFSKGYPVFCIWKQRSRITKIVATDVRGMAGIEKKGCGTGGVWMILPVLFFVCLFDFYLKHLQIFPKGFLIYIFCFIRTKNNSCKLFYCEGYKNFCEP